ncbi:unnamed protein product [Linum tenue]|uniref:Uncharacterized protein n=1 Tax=Linum tenue TaxID=586396 RepID=A0AAV0H1I1_9ROSI|nr:unnamed protein product [Linum tenue]
MPRRSHLLSSTASPGCTPTTDALSLRGCGPLGISRGYKTRSSKSA